MALLSLKSTAAFTSSSLTEQFQLILSNFSEHLIEENILIKPFSKESIVAFECLDTVKKKAIIADLLTYYSVCQEFLTREPSLRKTSALVEKMLTNQGWDVSKNFFETLENDDIVEIYRTDFTQVFRNIKFLEICSYSLGDLYVRPWVDLYRRPQSITDELVNILTSKVFTNEESLYLCNLPEHFLEERSSDKKNLFSINQKVLAPIYQSGQVYGFIGTLKASLIGSKTDSVSELNVRPLSL